MITITYPGIDGLDAKVLGRQKDRLEAKLAEKKAKKQKADPAVIELESEEDLSAEIVTLMAGPDDSVLLAEFDTPEEAEVIGLRMDARFNNPDHGAYAGMDTGVGIKGKKVSFWRRVP